MVGGKFKRKYKAMKHAELQRRVLFGKSTQSKEEKYIEIEKIIEKRNQWDKNNLRGFTKI